MAYFTSHIFKIHRFSPLNTYTLLNKYSITSSKESSVFKHKKSNKRAHVIYSVHAALRKESQNKDDEEVRLLWLKHTNNKKVLQEYCDAAFDSATKSRIIGDICRTRWTYDSLKRYFFDGIQTNKLNLETIRAYALDPTSLKDFNHKARAVLKRYEEVNKLRILDVGSCYNPFGKFDDLEVTPIDLHPANPEVHRCDFLNLKIIEGEDQLEDVASPVEKKSIYNIFFNQSLIWKKFNILLKSVWNIGHQNKEISKNIIDEPKKKIKQNEIHGIEKNNCDISRKIEFNGSLENLPEENILSGNNSENLSVSKDGHYISELKAASFDAVIFSYFIDYIPTAKLRYVCCLKAYKLLKPSGVLCIISPINRSKTNSLNVKLCRCTLALMGFERVMYKRVKYFQAMMFRKCLSPATRKNDAEAELNSLESEFYEVFPNLDWENVRDSIYDISDAYLMEEQNNTTNKE